MDETGSSSTAVNLQIILTPRRKQQLMKPENEGDAGRFMSQVFLRKWNQSTRRFPWKHLYEQQMRWRDNVSCLQTAHSLIRQNHCDLTLLCSTSPLWQNTAGFMKINIWRGIISAGFKVGKISSTMSTGVQGTQLHHCGNSLHQLKMLKIFIWVIFVFVCLPSDALLRTSIN